MNNIIKKFKFKADPTVINAPTDLQPAFTELGCLNLLEKKSKNKDTLVFINNNTDYVNFLSNELNRIEPDSVLWFAYPKGSSGIETDINRDTLRVTAEEYGITTVTAISINDTWSALRFRPIDKVGK